MNIIKSRLKHPLTVNLHIDDRETTIRRKHIIQEKPFLHQIYLEWYDEIRARIPEKLTGPILELGSGGGFLNKVIPTMITSDVLLIPEIDLIVNGISLPFKDETLGGIIMVNVLHHIPDPAQFFAETVRCLVEKSFLIMLEPWMTPWSKFIYKYFHDEGCDPKTNVWQFSSTGPLTGANNAMAWILFKRDRDKFAQAFPKLRMKEITPCMPFRYLLSGGVALRDLMPEWSYQFWRMIDNNSLLKNWFSMFAYIVLEKVEQDV